MKCNNEQTGTGFALSITRADLDEWEAPYAARVDGKQACRYTILRPDLNVVEEVGDAGVRPVIGNHGQQVPQQVRLGDRPAARAFPE